MENQAYNISFEDDIFKGQKPGDTSNNEEILCHIQTRSVAIFNETFKLNLVDLADYFYVPPV